MAMKRNLLGLGLAVVVAVGMLSPSAFALTASGNNSQKGSLLIFPRIEIGDGVDTLITITNDSSLPVLVKCFYATSDPMPTPYTGTARGARPLKHLEDFSIGVTHNQPIAWWASTGKAYSASKKSPRDEVLGDNR
jgi:hypothetical protein